MPKAINRTPAPWLAYWNHRLADRKKSIAPSVKRPMARKGIIIPMEKARSRAIPSSPDDVVPASIKMLPKIGPTQGLQPTLIVAPTMKDPT